MIKLSVIVPVYNAAENLHLCLESLCAQTITGMEVILVDDHGRDNSISIAQKFIQTNNLQANWHIVATAKNAGPGIARNEGLKHAKGEYIAFADADDWMEKDMYEKLYMLSKDRQADVAICNAYRHEQQKVICLSNPIYRSSSQYLSHYVAYLWTYMFRRDFIESNGLQFPSASSAEDSYFIASAIMMTNNVVQCSEALYHYIVYPNSISHQKNLKRYKQKLRVFSSLIQFARNKGLLSKYRFTLYWVYFKKAIVTSFVEYIASIRAK